MNRQLLLVILFAAVLTPLSTNCTLKRQARAAQESSAVEQVNLENYRAASIERWAAAIAALEARDQIENHPDNSILFVGSSSIRRWSAIAGDMAPYHAIQRGFGGAKWTDVAIFADRLIAPHKVSAVVFFVGNDITGGADDRSPAEVAGLFAYVLEKVRQHHGPVPVFYLAVTPTESRWKVWPKIRAGNGAVRRLCEREENTFFIGTESLFLDKQGHPRPELFVADQLHLSRDGYIRWNAAIKSHLDSVLAPSARVSR